MVKSGSRLGASVRNKHFQGDTDFPNAFMITIIRDNIAYVNSAGKVRKAILSGKLRETQPTFVNTQRIILY